MGAASLTLKRLGHGDIFRRHVIALDRLQVCGHREPFAATLASEPELSCSLDKRSSELSQEYAGHDTK